MFYYIPAWLKWWNETREEPVKPKETELLPDPSAEE